MGFLKKVGDFFRGVGEKIGDGFQAVGNAIKSTVQAAVNAIKDVGQVVGCLMRGDLQGAMKHAMSALGNIAQVASFVACPALSCGSAFVSGSVGGKAGDALGMLMGGPKALLSKGMLPELAMGAAMGGMGGGAMGAMGGMMGAGSPRGGPGPMPTQHLNIGHSPDSTRHLNIGFNPDPTQHLNIGANQMPLQHLNINARDNGVLQQNLVVKPGPATVGLIGPALNGPVVPQQQGQRPMTFADSVAGVNQQLATSIGYANPHAFDLMNAGAHQPTFMPQGPMTFEQSAHGVHQNLALAIGYADPNALINMGHQPVGIQGGPGGGLPHTFDQSVEGVRQGLATSIGYANPHAFDTMGVQPQHQQPQVVYVAVPVQAVATPAVGGPAPDAQA